MAKPGPRREPTIIKMIKGNPGKRPINYNEPQPKPLKVLRAPQGMSSDARREWRRLAPQLHALGLLTELDRNALEGYCTLFARWKRCEQKALEEGEIIRYGKKVRGPSPYVSLAHKTYLLLLRTAAEFGFTPSSRSSIVAFPPEAACDHSENKYGYLGN